MSTHTFVVPAYGRSPYLEECIKSLKDQHHSSPIVIVTSTPFGELETIAARHGVALHVHSPNSGIGHDWNVALRVASSQWITLAHQDDIYHPDYTRTMLDSVASAPQALIAFCRASELRNGADSSTTPLMLVKMLLTEQAFLGRSKITHRRTKRRLLAFGTPIVCPSVMFNREQLHGSFAFQEDLKCNLDWAAWLELADRAGSFVLCREPLVSQRTHAEAETTKAIALGWREKEDMQMFTSLWPAPIARLIMRVYRLSYLNRREMT